MAGARRGGGPGLVHARVVRSRLRQPRLHNVGHPRRAVLGCQPAAERARPGPHRSCHERRLHREWALDRGRCHPRFQSDSGVESNRPLDRRRITGAPGAGLRDRRHLHLGALLPPLRRLWPRPDHRVGVPGHRPFPSPSPELARVRHVADRGGTRHPGARSSLFRHFHTNHRRHPARGGRADRTHPGCRAAGLVRGLRLARLPARRLRKVRKLQRECDIIGVDQSMATNRRQPKTLLALAILALPAERPKHPYEMKQHMHQRGVHRAIPTKAASIYDTVERLTKAGFIEPVLTNREGRRPERTIYRLTGAGGDELESWLRQLIEQPAREYPRFGAALMFVGALRRKEEAIKALERRAAAFEEEIENVDSMLRGLPPLLPRLFVIEDEYTQAMRRAELEWLRRTIAELKEGTLEWPSMIDEMEWPMS